MSNLNFIEFKVEDFEKIKTDHYLKGLLNNAKKLMELLDNKYFVEEKHYRQSSIYLFNLFLSVELFFKGLFIIDAKLNNIFGKHLNISHDIFLLINTWEAMAKRKDNDLRKNKSMIYIIQRIKEVEPSTLKKYHHLRYGFKNYNNENLISEETMLMQWGLVHDELRRAIKVSSRNAI